MHNILVAQLIAKDHRGGFGMTKAADRGTSVLMFSGGRDSSIAAMRLAKQGEPLVLVTVSASHLHGVDSVKRRLKELTPHVPVGTRWVRISQPETGAKFGGMFERTCLPCQHDYALSGAILARKLGIGRLAFGYVSYQQDWPEQSPVAIEALEAVLSDHRIGLELPVYDLRSKDEAIRELLELGLSSESLEQKCSRQIFNVALNSEDLADHVTKWARELAATLGRAAEIEITTLEDVELSMEWAS